MSPAFPKLFLFLIFLLLRLSFFSAAQTQDDFDKKMSEVYSNSADKKKALALAKELYNMTERKKELQTFTNYTLLKNIFENTVPDAALAKTCGEKAQKKLNESIGLTPPPQDFGNDSMNQWYTQLYPALFSTRDPQNADKAIAFINKYISFKNFSTYTFIAYAYERNGDFGKARENYEKALAYTGNEKEEYHSWMYYSAFLARSGDYLKAEEYIRRMERLSQEASDYFKDSYKAEALSTRVVYYLNIGDYQHYVEAAEKNFDYLSALWHKNNANTCDPYPAIRFLNAAYAREMLKDYSAAERLWKSRDSANYIWVNCHNKTYPNSRYYPISMYPVYLIKRGKPSGLDKPVSFYIKETEDHYNSYSQYADISINFAKATQLGFLGSAGYPAIFKPILEQIRDTKNFRESTSPFYHYAYFSMRDRKYDEAGKTYAELFKLNRDWINDIIFTFGEKAFVTYYNAKLKEGYENFHSFVKLAAEKQPDLFASVAGQAYDNLLFTKSISLKGTQKRKEAFLKTNDPAVIRLYDEWIEKKQQLIRQYMKADDPSGPDTSVLINKERLRQQQDEVNRLENELAAKAKDFKKLLSITPPGWKEVQAKLKEGEAAVEMIRFNWRDQVYYSDTAFYAAYIITRNSSNPDVVYLPDPAADLDNKYYRVYKNNIKSKTDDKDSYNHFWKTIAGKLSGVKKVYFSPDGIYNLVNISTLKNPLTGQFVLDETEIHSTTSTGEIVQAGTGPKEILTAVLIGRPSYRWMGPVTTSVRAGDETRSFVNSLRGSEIPDLPGTEEEVLAIKKQMEQNKIGVNTYLKDQATEERLYKLHSPGVLHIATHGYWSGTGDATEGYRVFNAMVNSGLLLAGVVNYYNNTDFPNTYDGILTAYEAQNLDLRNTSLVILSACETTLGYLDAGEGVYGLQRAFRAAGAGSIMTSLWKVDDNATRDFMIAFYDQFLKTRDKAAAFRAAQKMTREKYIHPYYWGAFVLVGE